LHVGRHVVVHSPGQAKVTDAQLTGGVDKDVGGLQVTVHDLHGPQKHLHIGDLQHNAWLMEG
jgi:hypothetical protein